MRVTDANSDWWVHTAVGQPVDPERRSRSRCRGCATRARGAIAGSQGVQLNEYLKETITVPQSVINT